MTDDILDDLLTMKPPGACCPECKVTADGHTQKLREALARETPRRFGSPPPRKLVSPYKDNAGYTASLTGKAGDLLSVDIEIKQTCVPIKFCVRDSAGDVGTLIRLPKFRTVGEADRWIETEKLTAKAQALGCGLSFGVHRAGDKFTIEVKFLADCEWNAVLIATVRP